MTTLVLLHAFPLDSSMWDPLRPLLGAHEIVTPDQRGFGAGPLGSGHPSLDLVADDVAALLDRLGTDDVVLGGLSMGGYVTLAFLRRHPGRVRGVVLADTKASADPEAARDKRLRIAATVEVEGTLRVLHEEVEPGLLGATTRRDRPGVVTAVHRLVARATVPAVAWAQRAMAARLDTLDVVRSLDVPVLAVVGAEDGLTPPADAEAMAAAAQHASLEVLPGAGHLSALEDPARFAASLEGWLDAAFR